jgi:hypothetical protein
MFGHRARMSRATAGVVSSAVGLLFAGPARAAPLLADVDWHDYLDWQSYTGGRGTLLLASVALLLVALVLKFARMPKADEETAEVERLPMQRIGNMPIRPPQEIDAAH